MYHVVLSTIRSSSKESSIEKKRVFYKKGDEE